MKERHTKIIEIVSQRKKVEVSELAQILGATPATIRKDLSYLSDKGILNRERGYAVLKSTGDINYRMAFDFETKKRIAHYAASLVKENEMILLESGSLCALFAEEVVAANKNVTFITNSAYIAKYVQKDSDARVILLGGNFQKQSQAAVGPMTRQCVKTFEVGKIFVGIDGFSSEIGFMGNDIDRADTIQAMAESASELIIMAESGKFSTAAPIPCFSFDAVSQVITDSGIESETKQLLEDKGIRVTVV